MLRIIIVRPGVTEFDEQGRIKGTLDVPLNLVGTDQAKKTAVELHSEAIDAIYTGPCSAAKQTAQELAEHKHPTLKVIEALKNLDLGLWNGRRIDELRTHQPRVYKQWQEHPETVSPPGGETLEGARDRVRKALRKIVKRHKNGTVVLVLMEPLASIACSMLQSTELGDLWKAEEACGQWDLIDFEPKQAVALAKHG